MNINASMTYDNNTPHKTIAGLLYHEQAQDYALYRHSRARFLQQSALYLGADLNDSKVLSLCYSDNIINK